MKKFNLIKMAASSLALGTVLLGGTVTGEAGSLAEAKTTDGAAKAAKLAERAGKAFAEKKFDKAIAFGEAAVSLEPQNMGYRLALGDTYFGAGRFKSASVSFEDVLELSPGHSRAALKLSLAQIALGDVDGARALLAEYKSQLAAADYGLALALSGDADGAVSELEAALRDGSADARGRQNLALAYALAGKWKQSRVLAAQDLSPDLVDARMTEWAALARPKSSYDQVAAILRIKPVYDPGQPVQLALARTGQRQMAVVAAPAPAAFEVAQAIRAEAEPSPVYEMGSQAPAAAPVAVAAAPRAFPNVVMGPRQEIVQRIPAASEAPIVRAASKTFKTEIARSPKLAVVSKVSKPVKAAVPVKSATASKLAAAPKAKPVAGAVTPKLAASAKAKPVAVAAAPRQAVVAPQSGKKIEAGQFVVQLGAFGSKGAAEAAWGRLATKAGLNAGDAVTASVKSKGATLHRLAASGFDSAAQANAVCAKVKAAGGQCFVRSGKADDTIRWAFLKPAKPTQLASR